MSSYETLNEIADDNNDDIVIQPDINGSKSAFKKSTLPPYSASSSSNHTTATTQPKKTFEGGLLSLNHYRQYFDLNTSDFFNNCTQSLNPLSQPLADDYNKVGDLYASIWITASLVFFLFFCNSFASLLSGWFLGTNLDSLKINYFKMIVSSINLLYGYTIVIPLILYLLLRFYFKVLFLVPLTKLISIYSYSNLLWMPTVFLSIFRGFLVNHNTLDSILKWTCICTGALLSGCSFIYKLKVYFSTIFGEEEQKSVIILLGLLILAHAGFAIGVKVCFFGNL